MEKNFEARKWYAEQPLLNTGDDFDFDGEDGPLLFHYFNEAGLAIERTGSENVLGVEGLPAGSREIGTEEERRELSFEKFEKMVGSGGAQSWLNPDVERLYNSAREMAREIFNRNTDRYFNKACELRKGHFCKWEECKESNQTLLSALTWFEDLGRGLGRLRKALENGDMALAMVMLRGADNAYGLGINNLTKGIHEERLSRRGNAESKRKWENVEGSEESIDGSSGEDFWHYLERHYTEGEMFFNCLLIIGAVSDQDISFQDPEPRIQ